MLHSRWEVSCGERLAELPRLMWEQLPGPEKRGPMGG